MNKQLEEFGYMVLPNILTNDECINYRTQIWDELKYVSKNKFNYDNTDTWSEFENFKPENTSI